MAKKKQYNEYSSYKKSSKNPVDFLNHFRYEKYPVNSNDEFASEAVEVLPDSDGQYVDYEAAVAAIKWAQDLTSKKVDNTFYRLHIVHSPGLTDNEVFDNQAEAIRVMNALITSKLKPMGCKVYSCKFVNGKLENDKLITQFPYK